MLRRTFIQLPAALAAQGPALPEYYKQVAALVWVVEDADKTASEWERLGVQVSQPMTMPLKDATFRGKASPTAMKVRSGNFGATIVHWVQPDGQDNAFADFLKANRGSGVLSMLFGPPTLESYNAEAARLKAIAPALMEASFDAGDAVVRFVMFDTRKEGLYSIGLVHPGDQWTGDVRADRRITQYAWVTKSPEKVSAYWEKFGLPAFTYSTVNGRDSMYRGKPGDFNMRLGWQRHGRVAYEWIEPLKGPSCYHEHLDSNGEGFHHIAFNVQDMDAAISTWQKDGYEVAMSGAWGEQDQPGSGRYAYIDTRKAGGLFVELLWNYRRPA